MQSNNGCIQCAALESTPAVQLSITSLMSAYQTRPQILQLMAVAHLCILSHHKIFGLLDIAHPCTLVLPHAAAAGVIPPAGCLTHQSEQSTLH